MVHSSSFSVPGRISTSQGKQYSTNTDYMSSTVQIQTIWAVWYKYKLYKQYSTNTEYMSSTVQMYKYRLYEQYSTNTDYMSRTVQIQTIWLVQYKYRLYEQYSTNTDYRNSTVQIQTILGKTGLYAKWMIPF